MNSISSIQNITCFSSIDTVIFAGTYGDGVYRSKDEGLNWSKPANTGLQHPVVSLISGDSILYAGTWGGAVYQSTNAGDSWTQMSIPNYNAYVTSLFILNNKLFMASAKNLFYTTDSGTTWNAVPTLMPVTYIGMVITSGSNLYLGSDQGMFLSTDEGGSWNNIGLTDPLIEAVAVSGGNLIAGTRDVGIFTSQDKGASWLQTGALNNMLVQALAVVDSNLIVGNNSQEGVFISHDNGSSIKNYNNLDHSYTLCLRARGTDIFAGTEMALSGGGGVFKSTDLGKSWSCIGLKNSINVSIGFNNSYLFIGTDHGVIRTSNDGLTWNQVNSGLPVTRINSLEAVDSVIYAAVYNGVYRTTDNGLSWKSCGLRDTVVSALLYKSGSLFACTSYGIFKSAPPDTSWLPSGFTDSSAVFLYSSGSLLFASVNNKLFLSRDNAVTWTPINTGIDPNPVSAFTLSDNYLYAGTWGGGVWRRSMQEIIADVKSEVKNQPLKFSLNQNYPNPFNPSTAISFSLSTSCKVSIKIYDMLGSEIAVLADEQKPAGNHTINFNAEGKLSSGVYFYRLKAVPINGSKNDEFVSARKMILLK